jgi:hypothetical protein
MSETKDEKRARRPDRHDEHPACFLAYLKEGYTAKDAPFYYGKIEDPTQPFELGFVHSHKCLEPLGKQA